jgi:CRP/FNR family transcriptional regulator
MRDTVEPTSGAALYHVILAVVSDDLDGLAAVPFLGTLTRPRLARLAAVSFVRTVPEGRVVALRGEASTHLLVVETGALTAIRDTAAGQRLRLGEFPAPCAVEKAAVLDGNGYTATWVAATVSRIRSVPAREVLAAVDDVPAARRHVLAHLAFRLRESSDELVSAHFTDAATRTAAWLVRAAGRTGPRVVLPGAQHGLAEAIGVTRVSVNRSLRTLASEGLIRVEPGAVVITAPELLARRADPEHSPHDPAG